jgi:hypothetical protein
MHYAACACSACCSVTRARQTAGAHSANTDCKSQKTQDACDSAGFCTWDGGKCDYSSSSTGQVNKNLFVVLAFCYQFGVLLSRSSLSYIKVCTGHRSPNRAQLPHNRLFADHAGGDRHRIAGRRRRKRVSLALSDAAVCQALNLALWLAQVQQRSQQPSLALTAHTSPQDLLRFMNVWVQFVVMVVRHAADRVFAALDSFSPSQVWVGLMGGASYVNTFYLLLNHKDIPAKDK